MDNELLKDRMKKVARKHNDKLQKSLATIVSKRRGKVPEQILYRLASAYDEAMFNRLKKANDKGQLIEQIAKEPRLKTVKKYLDQEDK